MTIETKGAVAMENTELKIASHYNFYDATLYVKCEEKDGSLYWYGYNSDNLKKTVTKTRRGCGRISRTTGNPWKRISKKAAAEILAKYGITAEQFIAYTNEEPELMSKLDAQRAEEEREETLNFFLSKPLVSTDAALEVELALKKLADDAETNKVIAAQTANADYQPQTNWVNPHDFTICGDLSDRNINGRIIAANIARQQELELTQMKANGALYLLKINVPQLHSYRKFDFQSVIYPYKSFVALKEIGGNKIHEHVWRIADSVGNLIAKGSGFDDFNNFFNSIILITDRESEHKPTITVSQKKFFADNPLVVVKFDGKRVALKDAVSDIRHFFRDIPFCVTNQHGDSFSITAHIGIKRLSIAYDIIEKELRACADHKFPLATEENIAAFMAEQLKKSEREEILSTPLVSADAQDAAINAEIRNSVQSFKAKNALRNLHGSYLQKLFAVFELFSKGFTYTLEQFPELIEIVDESKKEINAIFDQCAVSADAQDVAINAEIQLANSNNEIETNQQGDDERGAVNDAFLNQSIQTDFNAKLAELPT